MQQLVEPYVREKQTQAVVKGATDFIAGKSIKDIAKKLTAYRRSVGVTDRRMVFHSFRHTFKDYLRGSGVEDGVQRALMGHSRVDTADSYGSGFALHRLVEGMRCYRVPGLVLPQPAKIPD